MNIFRLEICDLLEKVNMNTSGVFDRTPRLISILPQNISEVIEDNKVYISEFIIAKVKGRVKMFDGHLLITDKIFLQISETLSNPDKILSDNRIAHKNKFLFIILNPLYLIAVEVKRLESGLTEVNTIYELEYTELKRLEAKLPTVFSSGGTPSSAYSPPS